MLNLNEAMNEFNPTPQILSRSGSETPKLLIEKNAGVNGITTIPILTAGDDKLKTTFVRNGETDRCVCDCLAEKRLMCWSDNGWCSSGVMLQTINQTIMPYVNLPHAQFS